MSGERSLGEYGGLLSVGEVVNVKDDPSQSGMVRVRWLSGSAAQDQIADGDLPWTRAVFPVTNASKNQVGGPHTGLTVGSRVVGFPLDGSGQEFVILGTIVKGGSGGLDSPPVYDSDIPQPAKVQSNDGVSQPRFGDVNSIVSKGSIVNFGETQGGNGLPAAFAQLTDSIGEVNRITSGLVGELQDLKNLSGSIRSSVFSLPGLKGAIQGMPFDVSSPALSQLMSGANVASGLVDTIRRLGDLNGLGDIQRLLSGLASELGTGSILDVDPQVLVHALTRSISSSELSQVLGKATSLSSAIQGVIGR